MRRSTPTEYCDFGLEMCRPMAPALPMMRAGTSVDRCLFGSSRASISPPVPIDLGIQNQTTMPRIEMTIINCDYLEYFLKT